MPICPVCGGYYIREPCPNCKEMGLGAKSSEQHENATKTPSTPDMIQSSTPVESPVVDRATESVKEAETTPATHTEELRKIVETSESEVSNLQLRLRKLNQRW